MVHFRKTLTEALNSLAGRLALLRSLFSRTSVRGAADGTNAGGLIVV